MIILMTLANADDDCDGDYKSNSLLIMLMTMTPSDDNGNDELYSISQTWECIALHTYIQWWRSLVVSKQQYVHWTCSHHKYALHLLTFPCRRWSQRLFLTLPKCRHTSGNINNMMGLVIVIIYDFLTLNCCYYQLHFSIKYHEK